MFRRLMELLRPFNIDKDFIKVGKGSNLEKWKIYKNLEKTCKSYIAIWNIIKLLLEDDNTMIFRDRNRIKYLKSCIFIDSSHQICKKTTATAVQYSAVRCCCLFLQSSFSYNFQSKLRVCLYAILRQKNWKMSFSATSTAPNQLDDHGPAPDCRGRLLRSQKGAGLPRGEFLQEILGCQKFWWDSFEFCKILAAIPSLHSVAVSIFLL